MGRSEYIRIHIRLIIPEIITHYNLNGPVYQYGWIYMGIVRGMYGLPQAGIISNNLLAQILIKRGYYQVRKAPGLWRHVWRTITFTVVVENNWNWLCWAGSCRASDQCIKNILLKNHKRLGRKLYCSITMKQYYIKKYVGISMPGYIK